jgi:phytoene desaturase
MSRKAIVIGSGFGGVSLAMRLQSLGFETQILEALADPGGRARVLKQDGFVFDMGPTVITVPHFIEELFTLEKNKHGLNNPDFPKDILDHGRALVHPNTAARCQIVPVFPFYRIWFFDGTWFDYDGDHDSTLKQIAHLAPEDVAGYLEFHDDAKAIFQRGFLELGYTFFDSVPSMLQILPELVKLDAVRTLFSFASKYFKSDKMRQVFSFETLLVGGSPTRVPSIYAMIHFVEKTWGIHYVKGGTGALMRAFIQKFEEMGGELKLNAKVTEILVEGGGPGFRLPGQEVKAKGVLLASGEKIHADLVACNADIANSYLKLVPGRAKLWNCDLRIKAIQQSMSLVVIYFGFKSEGLKLNLQHHNVILSKRYEDLLSDLFDYKHLPEDFSQYLHLPTLTDPSLAPEGCHACYTLVPVPNQKSGIDWKKIGSEFVDKVLQFLDDEGYIPGLMQRLVTKSFVTPDYFENDLDSYLGNAFGVEPILQQSAFFRPHNRSEDVTGLYFVGAGTQPGAGTPSVMMSAKMTARAVAQDFGLL